MLVDGMIRIRTYNNGSRSWRLKNLRILLYFTCYNLRDLPHSLKEQRATEEPEPRGPPGNPDPQLTAPGTAGGSSHLYRA